MTAHVLRRQVTREERTMSNETYTDNEGRVWRWQRYSDDVLFAVTDEEDVCWSVLPGTPETRDNLATAAAYFEATYGEPAETPWLTLGELRRRTAHLPDSTPLTASTPDGDWWLNLELDPSGIPSGNPDSDDPPSIILGTIDNFDTRQW
jgi:hypothetical protein